MTRISAILAEAARKLGYLATPDQLKRKGIKKVRVVGVDRMSSLIHEAVDRTLREMAVGFGRADRNAIAGAAREEFLHLLKSHQELEQSRAAVLKEKEKIEQDLDGIRRELEEQRRALRQRREDLARDALLEGDEGVDRALAERIGQLFTLMGRDDPASRNLREEVCGVVLEWVAEARRRWVSHGSVEKDHETELLERRIAKLARTLAETEEELRNVARLKEVDPGISSVYRTVQGLDASDARAGLRRELMAAIFQANVELRRRTAMKKESESVRT